MKNIDWPGNGKKATNADAARLGRDLGWFTAPDADGVHRRRLHERKKKALMLALCFVALWILVSRLSALMFSSSVIEVLFGFWMALNGTIFINAIVVARMEGWI